MNTENLNMTALFEQLGLDNSTVAIQQFLLHHSPLHQSIALHKATFWTHSQASFLLQAIALDSEWAYQVDELDALLR